MTELIVNAVLQGFRGIDTARAVLLAPWFKAPCPDQRRANQSITEKTLLEVLWKSWRLNTASNARIVSCKQSITLRVIDARHES